MSLVLRLILICCLAAQPLSECRLLPCAAAAPACCCQGGDGATCSCCEQKDQPTPAPAAPAPEAGKLFSALPLYGGVIALPVPARAAPVSASPVPTALTARDIRVKLCVWLT